MTWREFGGYEGWPVLVNPDCHPNTRKKPGAVGRILYRNSENTDILIIYLPDYEYYEAYRSDELLTLLPGNRMLDNLIANYDKLERKEVKDMLRVYSLFEDRYYDDAFDCALRNDKIASLCITDCKRFFSMVSEVD